MSDAARVALSRTRSAPGSRHVARRGRPRGEPARGQRPFPRVTTMPADNARDMAVIRVPGRSS